MLYNFSFKPEKKKKDYSNLDLFSGVSFDNKYFARCKDCNNFYNIAKKHTCFIQEVLERKQAESDKFHDSIEDYLANHSEADFFKYLAERGKL